jgi:hypothetical protein
MYPMHAAWQYRVYPVYDKIHNVDYSNPDDTASGADRAPRRTSSAPVADYSSWPSPAAHVGDHAWSNRSRLTHSSMRGVPPVRVERDAVSWTRRGRHRAIDELRRLNVRPEGSSVELNEALQTTAHPDGLDDVLEVRRRREVVRSVLAGLPAPQREA